MSVPQSSFPAGVCLAMLLAVSGAMSAARGAQDQLDRAIKQAENAVSASGAAAAASRAKVFAREVCRTVGPTDAKSFLDHYDEVQRDREQQVSEIRQILQATPADAPGRDLVEEGIRMALLLRDARDAVTACIGQRQSQSTPNAPHPDDIAESAEQRTDPSLALGAGGWARYTNARYGFSVAYPHSLFAPAPEADNGDGRAFVARDGSGAEIRVSGSLNIDGQSPKQFKRWLVGTVPGYHNVTYQPVGKDWFVLSGFHGDKIYYDKTIFSCEALVLVTLAMTCPAAEKAAYDPIVKRVLKSSRTGPGIDTPNCR